MSKNRTTFYAVCTSLLCALFIFFYSAFNDIGLSNILFQLALSTLSACIFYIIITWLPERKKLMYARKMRSPILKILKSQIEPLLQNVRAAHKKANGYSDASMKIHKKEDGQWKVIPLTYIFEQCISTINQYLNIDDEYFKDSKEKIKSHLRGLKELRDASENPTLKINPVLNCLESLKKDISSIEEELKQSTSIHHL